jgi:hypothetical protein
MDGATVSFLTFWSVVGAATLFVVAARRLRPPWP